MPSLDRILRTLASLRITVVLLGLIVLLIFFGSLAQRFMGIWYVLDAYFKHPIVWVDLRIFAPAGSTVTGSFPFVGGVTLGVGMLVNLLAAFSLKFHPVKNPARLAAGILVAMAGAGLVAAGHLVPELRLRLAENWVSMLFGGLLLYTPVTVGFLLLYGKRGGLVMSHLAVLLLIVGQGITTYRALETHMVLRPGDTLNYAEDGREYELAVGTPKKDGSGMAQVECVPQSMLEKIDTSEKAFTTQRIALEHWFPNARLDISKDATPDELATLPPPPGAPMLVGKRLALEEGETVNGFGAAMDNTPGALVKANGRTIALYGGDLTPRKVPGTDITLQLRPKRHFLPYAIRLKKFTHDLYPGTTTPKNFASTVMVLEAGKAPREVDISMNHPLRLHDETLFQASFLDGDSGTVLQVVRNPGWTIPYIACALGAIGLLVHFVLSLGKFLKKTSAQAPKSETCAHEPRGDGTPVQAASPGLAPGARERKSMLTWFLPAFAAAVSILVLASATRLTAAMVPSRAESPNISAFAELPIVAGGRVQPIDSLARNSLLSLSGNSELRLPKAGKEPARTLSAAEWLLDVMSNPELADTYPLFRIDHDAVKALIGQKDSQEKRFSMAQIKEHLTQQDLGKAFMEAGRTQSEKRDAREHALAELEGRITLYAKLRGRAAMLAIAPPHSTGRHDALNWLPMPDALLTMQRYGWASDAQIKGWVATLGEWDKLPQGTDARQRQVDGWTHLQEAWAKHDGPAFDAAVGSLAETHAQLAPQSARMAATETAFNRADPFYLALWIYVCAALTVFAAWACLRLPLWRTAFTLVGIAFLVHTVALLVRIWISGRPPVTNLYSSAIFVGWGLAGFSLVAEYVLARFLHLRLGFALLVGAVAGAGTLMIAKALAADGDTLGVLVAVLDTNFWLGTHVVVITLGYAATFLAGLLGIVYLGAQLVLPKSDRSLLRALIGVVYGTLCFALLFSFIGTILGGIWADQSWGRFWGWDPKENGAMMIVLWNALILHARIGGLVKERGLAALAVLGNIVTAWSWFGVNQLSTGLHNYGFMDKAVFWLVAFIVANLLVAAVALVPQRKSA